MITLLYLLYNSKSSVERLVEHLAAQVLPSNSGVQAWFVDDGSKDGTCEALERVLDRKYPDGVPAWIQIRPNPKNLGLAGSLNYNLKKVETPFVLTCHVDAFFNSSDYVARMLAIMESNPQLAALTGKPVSENADSMSFAQKLNTVANLMDILPSDPKAPEWSPIGFAEGRCDTFRMKALQTVGLYPTELRTSGEDQILAGRLRKSGYEIGQANHLTYILSTSTAQDTFWRLVRHLFLFGSTQPYILVATRREGGAGPAMEGKNRQNRMQMRLLQLLVPPTLVALCFFPSMGGILLMTVLGLKHLLWSRQLSQVRMRGSELLGLFLGQFCLDTAYFCGAIYGSLKMMKRSKVTA